MVPGNRKFNLNELHFITLRCIQSDYSAAGLLYQDNAALQWNGRRRWTCSSLTRNLRLDDENDEPSPVISDSACLVYTGNHVKPVSIDTRSLTYSRQRSKCCPTINVFFLLMHRSRNASRTQWHSLMNRRENQTVGWTINICQSRPDSWSKLW